MNKIILNIAIMVSVLSLASCTSSSDHNFESGLSVSVNIAEGLDIEDLTLWVYDSNGDLMGEGLQFESLNALSSHLVSLDEAGDYTTVVGVNCASDFTATASSSLSSLMLSLTDDSATVSQSQESYYGLNTVSVSDGVYSVSYVDTQRIYTGFKALVRNLDPAVTQVDFSIVNSSASITLESGKYSQDRRVDFESVTDLSDYTAEFDFVKLLETAEGSDTQFEVTFTYDDATTQSTTISTPIIITSESWYSITLDYDDLSAGYIVLDSSAIKVMEWVDVSVDFGGSF